METIRIYLETTMFSFYHETRKEPHYQERRAQVQQVFDLIKAGKFEPYTSSYATDEFNKDPDPEKRKKMWRLIDDYGIKTLESSPTVRRLAALYIQEKAVSTASRADAAHIAITAINGLDWIVSLNFRHIARIWTIERVKRVNDREGLKSICIYRPEEVLKYEGTK